MEDESFDRALEPQPTKRKRSSILRIAEKRASRDSRTVSFNNQCTYKELHHDGTSDITNLFLRDDMDLTSIDIIEPVLCYQANQTVGSNMDISMDVSATAGSNISHSRHSDQTCSTREPVTALPLNISAPPPKRTRNSIHNMSIDQTMNETFIENHQPHHDQHQPQQQQQPVEQCSQMTIASADMSGISSLNSTLLESSIISITAGMTNNDIKSMSDIDCSSSTLVGSRMDQRDLGQCSMSDRTLSETMMMSQNNCSISRISGISGITDISSFDAATLAEKSANETFYGAFHESNVSLTSSRTSLGNTLIHNIESLNDCIEKVDEDRELNRRQLDAEIEELFKFYRHIVNKEDKYEFAIAIFGLRHSLWLILNINPDTYPNEKIRVRFAVNKKDRHLYPFPEYAEALRRTTREGRPGYLTRFVINSQRFRRFLRKIGYKKPTEK